MRFSSAAASHAKYFFSPNFRLARRSFVFRVKRGATSHATGAVHQGVGREIHKLLGVHLTTKAVLATIPSIDPPLPRL